MLLYLRAVSPCWIPRGESMLVSITPGLAGEPVPNTVGLWQAGRILLARTGKQFSVSGLIVSTESSGYFRSNIP